MRHFCRTALFAAVLVSPATSAAAVPLAGCYERVYDAAHLAAHKGQIVTRATLLVKATDEPMKAARGEIVADGNLSMWTIRHKERFDSLGACIVAGDGLSCIGSASAAEMDTCRSRTTGVRECRVYAKEDGFFEITRHPEGVVVTVRNLLELVPAPYDGGPFLNLNDKDAENNSFLLKPAAAEVCK